MKPSKLTSLFKDSLPIALLLIFFLLLFHHFNGLLLILSIVLFAYTLHTQPNVVLSSLLIIGIYCLRYHLILSRLNQATPKEYEICEVVTVPSVKMSGDYQIISFHCKTNQAKYHVRYRTTDFMKLSIGDWIEVHGSYSEPGPNTVPFLFNYKTYLLSQNIYYIIQAYDIYYIKSTNKPHYQLINMIIDRYEGVLKSYQLSLLIGDKKSFSEEFQTSTQVLNISHLFVISGFHVTSLAVMIRGVLRLFHVTKESILRITNIVLMVYLALNNFQPSILRAVMLFYGAQIKRRYHLPISTAHLLSLIFLINVLIAPMIVFHVGFQLSYFISFTLILSERLLRRYRHHPLMNTFLTTLIAQVFSIPIVGNFTFQYNLLSLFLSPFFLFYFSYIVFPLTFLTILIPFTSPMFYPLFRLYERVITAVSSIKVLTFTIGGFNSFRQTLYYFVTFLFFRQLELKRPYKKWGVLLILLTFFYYRLAISTTVAYIDVGQGDATFIQTSFQQCTMLIDTGGPIFPSITFHPGERNVLPYLKAHGLTSIDMLVVSHGDRDHIGDYRYILDEIKVKAILFSVYDTSELKQEIIAYSKQKNIPYYELKAGDTLSCGPLTIHIHAPERNMMDNNDRSLVFTMNIYGDKFLFTGDISSQVEEEISQNLPRDITFLKVAHHGSRFSTSNTLLRWIRPDYAIISVGQNHYGHPSPEVVERLHNYDVKLYTTQEDGTIVIKYFFNRRYIIPTRK